MYQLWQCPVGVQFPDNLSSILHEKIICTSLPRHVEVLFWIYLLVLFPNKRWFNFTCICPSLIFIQTQDIFLHALLKCVALYAFQNYHHDDSIFSPSHFQNFYQATSQSLRKTQLKRHLSPGFDIQVRPTMHTFMFYCHNPFIIEPSATGGRN